MSERETAGKISADLMKNFKDNTHTPREQMQEQLAQYDEQLHICVNKHKIEFAGDFYVVVLTKKERLMKNVLRNYFIARRTCPTPEWDQAVYKYNRKPDHIEFLLVVPAKDVCIDMTDNALMIDNEEKELLGYVLDYNDGTLLLKAKKLNGEK